MKALSISKEKFCSLEKVLEKLGEWMTKKLYGEVRIRIVAGRVKEVDWHESEHFD